MTKIEKFEDIKAWQKARELTKDIYKITNEKKFACDFNLRDQIRSASISIMLNIAEGFARKSNKDFSRFLVTAHASAAEVQSALYVALDQLYIQQEGFNVLYKKTEEVSCIIMGFLKYLKPSC